MKPEELLHLYGPYLPTDRFRALLRQADMPIVSRGAALLVDLLGFTPITTQLVTQYGAQRAGEEMQRRINPMFEAIAGQVFQHGGSVIRFTGDGFIAWFDDQSTLAQLTEFPGLLRAVCAGCEMQSLMRYFPGLRLKVCIGMGTAQRWVVGKPEYGLNDILSGPAVRAMASLAVEAQPDQVVVHSEAIPLLRQENILLELTETGNAVIPAVPESVSKRARQYRWSAWAAEGNLHEILDAVRPFVASAIREQIELGVGDFVGELRYAFPMFIQFNSAIGSTADPRATLNTYVRSVQHVLTTYGGRLVSVEVGDKGSVIFAVFGAPITYGDDAVRVMMAALTLREETSRTEMGIVQRFGISRGLLYAGTIGGEVRHEYSTIGDETNVAARLMTAAAVGQILTTSAVRKEAGTRVTFHDLAPIMVKGRAEPISITEPITATMSVARRTHVGKFVGREAELGQLHKLIRIVKSGSPRIVRIEGQAGIGKSRLVAQMTASAVAQGFSVAGGDCISTGGQIAYLPWREILLAVFDMSLDAAPDTNVQRLHAFVQTLNPLWLPRLPLLGDLLQLPIAETPVTAKLEDRTRRQAIAALVIEILIAIARQQPVLLLIEDIQWIDEVSEGLVIDLTRRLGIEPVPIMLVLMHRPLADHDRTLELLQTLADLHIHSRLLLDELSRRDVYTMIENHLDATVPPELPHFVYERTQGNPFFVQEVLDTLLETNRLQVIGTRAVIRGVLQDLDLPRTVQGLVQARIDRLSELDKLVLKVAAVIGREFQVRILAASLPISMSHEELLEHLQSLETREFSHKGNTEPELTYLFKHAITQEVTYQSLPFAQRKQLHQAVAATLEVIAPDEIERLAHHFALSGNAERARHYLIGAGQKAFREYANQAALAYFTQAFDLAVDDAERFDIAHQRTQVMLRLGDMKGVQAQLQAMQPLVADQPRCQAIVHSLWADYYRQTSAWTDTVREARAAIALAEKLRDDQLAWTAYRLLRSAYLSLHQRDRANALERPMHALSERLGNPRYVLELVLTWFDNVSTELPEIAIDGARTALAQAERLQDPQLEAECWTILADLYARENDLLPALDAFRQQISLARQIGDRRGEGLTLNRIGVVLISLGQLSEANAHLQDAFRILHQIGERAGEASSLVNLGVIAEHHQAYDEGIAYLSRGLVMQQSLDAAVDAALTLFHLGNCYMAKDQLDAARDALSEARHILVTANLPPRVAEVDIALAEIDLRLGDCTGAVTLITPLLPRLRDQQVGNLVLPGLAYWRVVQILTQCDQPTQAEELRLAFRDSANTLLSKIDDNTWHRAYIDNIWYHAALLNNPQPKP